MSPGRIVFPGNPWPAGHAIAELVWSGRVDPEGLFVDLHLVTAPYYAEDPPRTGDGPDEDEDCGDWESRIVWCNYHRCSLSSTKWGERRGIRVGTEDRPFDFDRLGELRADPLPVDWDVFEDTFAFGVYLLGHDSVADHHLAFGPGATPDERSMAWRGRIALTYAGDTSFEHSFEAMIPSAPFQGFVAEEGASPSEARARIDGLVTDPERYAMVERGGRVWAVRRGQGAASRARG